MMEQYFDINLEFDHKKLEETIIDQSILGKGYCCFVDSTILVEAYRNKNGVREVLNNALINSCDGGYIALMASSIYNKKLKAYNGPAFFNKFIYYSDTHCIIGNTPLVFKKVKAKTDKVSGGRANLHFLSLPYLNVDQFDYEDIAKRINSINARFIWISLGAPKQEIFMSKLLPLLNRGVMLGVGAALNYFSGEIKDIPNWAKKNNLIWFYRILTEPKKQIKRILVILSYYPAIYINERRKIKS